MDCIICDHTACDPASADVQFVEDVLYLPEPYFMAPTDVDSEDSSRGMWAPLHVSCFNCDVYIHTAVQLDVSQFHY